MSSAWKKEKKPIRNKVWFRRGGETNLQRKETTVLANTSRHPLNKTTCHLHSLGKWLDLNLAAHLMIHHYFPGRRLKYSYSYSLGQSNSLNATEPAMDKMLHIMSLAVLLNEIPLQDVRGINTHSNLSFQVLLPRHLICGVTLCQLHLPQPCVGLGGCPS